MFGKLLCLLGIHDWRLVINRDPYWDLRLCRRCPKAEYGYHQPFSKEKFKVVGNLGELQRFGGFRR